MGSRAILKHPLVLAGLLVSETLAGCLDDLPSPLPPSASLVCPPPAVHPFGDCETPIEESPKVGCLSLEQSTCLTGPRTSCKCALDECPVSRRNACEKEDICPEAVRSAVGEGELCLRLPAKAFEEWSQEPEQCACGCGQCASVCDGKGPVIGVLADGYSGGEYVPAAIQIGDVLPAAGKLGIYMRLRGYSQATLYVHSGKDRVQGYTIPTPPSTQFIDVVLLNQGINGAAYAWNKIEDKPISLELYGNGSEEEPGLTLLEIDCVLPFVLPNSEKMP